MNILYLSYDGLTDPLGRSQILPYLVGLSQHGFHFAVISFEKKNAMAQEGAIVSELCKAAGIEWYPCRYHKSPQVLSTISDLWVMHRKAKKLMKNTGFRIIHARSYPAALVASRLSLSTGIPWLFDMRGFWADERKESGLWPQQNPLYAVIYRFFKRKEQWFFQQAAHTVSLTELAREEICSTQGLVRNDRVSVIPCCADFQLFDPKRFSHG